MNFFSTYLERIQASLSLLSPPHTHTHTRTRARQGRNPLPRTSAGHATQASTRSRRETFSSGRVLSALPVCRRRASRQMRKCCRVIIVSRLNFDSAKVTPRELDLFPRRGGGLAACSQQKGTRSDRNQVTPHRAHGGASPSSIQADESEESVAEKGAGPQSAPAIQNGPRNLARRSPGTGGQGLLEGDLVDAGLVDAVDDAVAQFTHQLRERQDEAPPVGLLPPPKKKARVTLMSSGSQESSVRERTLEKWTPRLLKERTLTSGEPVTRPATRPAPTCVFPSTRCTA